MTIYLKQSTASQEVQLPRFVSSTDGDTESTALSIANTDIKIWKFGATTLASKNSGGATHIANGLYYAVLDATDTDTLGTLIVNVHVSGALPVQLVCCVLAANIYDSLIGGGDLLDVSMVQILGTAVSSPATAGILDVNAKNINNVATTPVTTINANVGTTQPTNFTGSGASAYIKTDQVMISGDSTAADNAESFFDGTGYNGANNIIPTVTTLTNAPSDSAGITTLLSRLSSARAGYLDNLSGGAVALASKLTKYIQLLARKDSAIATDNSAEVTEINANGGSGGGAYANTTDAQEALRDRGDAAWVTGTAPLDAAATRTALGLSSANLDTQLAALPTAAENAGAVWDEGITTHSTPDSAGEALQNAGAAGTPATAAEIADAVWDENLGDHTDSGSTGEALGAAGGAGDPWITSLPGAYSEGQAGYIVGTNLNAAVNSRASQTSVDAIDDYVDTEVAAIKVKTDQLAFTGGKVDAQVRGMDTDVLTADALKADAVTETQTGLATASALAAVQSDVDDIQSRIPAALTGAGNMKADALALSGDATAADNAESFFDGTGYAGTNNVIPVVTSVTNRVTANTDQIKGSDATNQIRDSILTDATRFAGANIDAAITSRLADAAYTAPTTPPTVTAIRQEMDANSTKLANLDAAVSTRSTLTAANVWAYVVEGSYTAVQFLRLIAAVLAGKVSGANTNTMTFRDASDTKVRVTASVDEVGNRADIDYDLD